jgi:hypothetical protein
MKLFPTTPEEKNNALVRVLVFVQLVAFSLYLFAAWSWGRPYDFYEALKWISASVALGLSLVIWGFCAVAYFSSKRYKPAWAWLGLGVLQTALLIVFFQTPARAKYRSESAPSDLSLVIHLSGPASEPIGRDRTATKLL